MKEPGGRGTEREREGEKEEQEGREDGEWARGRALPRCPISRSNAQSILGFRCYDGPKAPLLGGAVVGGPCV